MTFDVEDWFHLDGIPALSDRAAWAGLPSLVELRTVQFLRICEHAETYGTFFVLGWIAEHHPRLVPRILDAGHEVGSHGFWHHRVPKLTQGEFASDLNDSLDVLRAQGADVVGFRAPCFSVGPAESWIYDQLGRAGIRYSSSALSCGRGAHAMRTPGGAVVAELPLSRVGVGRFRVPFSGGGYLRALPLPVVEAAMSVEHRARRPTVVYVHPRDLAPATPRVPMPLTRRVMTHVNPGATNRKARALLARHSFGPCRDVLADMGLI